MFLRQGLAEFVVQMPQRVRVRPEELWIPALACWVRADGSTASFDITHNFKRVYFGRFKAWRIRCAVKAFRRLKEATAKVMEHYGFAAQVDTPPKGGDSLLAPFRGSAVLKGCAQ